MLLKVLRVDSDHPEPAAIEEAARIIRAGGIVAFPTETVYGLGGNALDPEAVERIYAAKGRPSYNPLIVHCADVQTAKELARSWPALADTLAARYWPGPLTLVLPKSDRVPAAVTAGLSTVALRVPRHPIAEALIRASGTPIAAPSANRYTELSATAAAHVARGLGGRVDLVLDGGPTPVGIESTVIDLTGPDPVLLRPGSVDRGEIEEILGRRLRDAEGYQAEAPRPAPGMAERHYSPRARLQLVQSDSAALAAAAGQGRRGDRVGALLRLVPAPPGVDEPIRMPLDPRGYASALYAELHRLDDAGCSLILVESPPAEPAWAAVLDRLKRASVPATGTGAVPPGDAKR